MHDLLGLWFYEVFNQARNVRKNSFYTKSVNPNPTIYSKN